MPRAPQARGLADVCRNTISSEKAYIMVVQDIAAIVQDAIIDTQLTLHADLLAGEEVERFLAEIVQAPQLIINNVQLVRENGSLSISGDTFLLNSDMAVVLTFSETQDAIGYAVQARPPATWRLRQSFPEIQGSFLEHLQLDNVMLHFASVAARNTVEIRITADIPDLGLTGLTIMIDLVTGAFHTCWQAPAALEIPGIDWFALTDAQLLVMVDPAVGLLSGAIKGTLVIDATPIPISVQFPTNDDSWLLQGAFEAVQLPGLASLTHLVGSDDLVQQIPATLVKATEGIRLSEINVRFSPTRRAVDYITLVLATSQPWELLPGSLSIHNIRLYLSVSHPTERALRAVAGGIRGQLSLAGLDVTLTGEARDAFVLRAQIPRLDLSALLDDVPLPDLLPDVSLSDIEVSYTPASGELSVHGTGSVDWELGTADSQWRTEVSVALLRRVAATTGQEPARSQVECRITMRGAGPVALGDHLTLHSLHLDFHLLQGQTWSVTGGVSAELFDRAFELEAHYSQTAAERTLMLSTNIAASTPLVTLEDLGAFTLSRLAIHITSSRPTGQPGPVSAPATAQAKPSTAWNVTAEGAMSIANVFDFAGTLTLQREANGTAGLLFRPTTADITIPLPAASEEARQAGLRLSFGSIAMVRSRAALDTAPSSSNWRFEASTSLSFVGMPALVERLLPPTLRATFTAADGVARLAVERLVETLTLTLPDIDIHDTHIPLGTVAVDLSQLSVQLGDAVAVSVQLGLGLPSELNNLFGVHPDGTPSLALFRTYNPDDRNHSLVRLQLDIDTQGIRFTPLSSPLQAMRLVQEGSRSFWYADFGEFGEIKLQVPVLRYDAHTSAFAASGSFEVVRPLQLPFTPIKALLRAADLSAAAELLPDALPLAELNIVDAQGNFRTAELVAMVEALTDGRLPDEIGPILNVIGDNLERLPESFRQYLHITIPESFAFAMAVAPDGSVRIDAGVQEGDAPLRFLQPRFDVTPLAPLPRLVFDGIELRSLAFGPILGGNLFLLQVDARVDQFDIATLVASLFLPENEAFPLPTSQALQRRVILDKLFMVIVYQTGIPIPVPLFYDQLGIEYLGIEGVGLQAHSAFPMPKVGLSTLTELFSNLKQFFSDREFLLDPQAPPGGTNLVFALDNNYLQLPEYLGGAVLGQKNDAVVIDVYASVAQMLNALKTLTLNRLIQIVPLEKRVGRARASFGFLGLEANWLLTTPQEFRQGAAQRLALTPLQQEEFLQILPTLPRSTRNTDSDEQGLIAFLRGQVESPNVAGLEAVFGLVASGPDGFSTGFRLTGTIANVLDLEVAGRVAIPASSGAQETPSPALPLLSAQGLEFDGKDDYVRIPQSAHLNFTGALTIEAWIKPQATDGLRNIVAHGHSFTPNGEILLRIHNGRYQVGSWNGRDHLSTFAVPTEDIGAWVHLAGLYDGTHWRLYRNGVEVAATPESTGAVTVNADWALGARSTGSERFFQGGLREVRLWNRALTALEIRDGMQRPLVGNEPGLAGYWPCDEGSGTTVQDHTAPAQHGTVQGAQWATLPAEPATAALQLVGHSHLNIFDRTVFQGEVRLIGADFQLQGAFDLFPSNSPLQASGHLIGEWSARRFYLAGDIQTRLAGLTLLGGRAIFSSERLLLQGTWLGATALLDIRKASGAIQLQGRVMVNMALQADLGVITRAIGSDTFRLTEQLRLDVSVATTLDITVDENGFLATIEGHFVLNGHNVTVGPLTLTVAPADLAEIAAALRQHLLAEPLRYFDLLYGDAAAWLAGLRSGALRLAGNVSQETGRVLRHAYGLGITQAAALLRGAGRSASEVGAALAAGYGQAAAVTANALRSAGYTAEEIARMLQSTYGLGAQEAIATLRNWYSAVDLGRVLQRVYGQGVQAAVQILRNINYPADQVGRLLQEAYEQGAHSAADTLRRAGYSVEEVSDMLRLAYGQGTNAILGVLRDVGYSAAEAARALQRLGASADQAASLLKHLWGQGNNEVNRFLKDAGYAASQVDRAVSNAFKDAGRAVKDFFGF